MAIQAGFWYNFSMQKPIYTSTYYTPVQLKLPLKIETIIDISDPVYSFREILDCIDLNEFLAVKECRTGRPRCDAVKLLKIILFSFMENGYLSLRNIEKACKTDIRYMWLLDGMKAPSHVTFGNFIKNDLSESVEAVFRSINKVIFAKEHVDTDHAYIDGTKIEANANKYTWVWKKACVRSRDKVFGKITDLLARINEEDLLFLGVRLESREEYAIEYVDQMLDAYKRAVRIDEASFVNGKGHHKSSAQRKYQELRGYRDRLRNYAKHIEVCGEERNSYSKTDHDATFMRVKRDYRGNDQLLPAYNMQVVICDEYIAAIDARQYASDMECFVPLMEKFRNLIGHYPKYPIADAGYGSYNNYLYCQEHGMEKYMKFTMYDKESKDPKYRDDPFRAINFKTDEDGSPVCPNGKPFYHKYDRHIRGNRYGRTEEIYECENCNGCPLKANCNKREGNRQIQLNRELTQIHREVLENLNSVHGALLRMNRSIQAEGTYGSMKWNRSYKRAFRRGLKEVILEFTLIAIGFNLWKYHNKTRITAEAAEIA